MNRRTQPDCHADINSTVVENSSSRVYWVPHARSNSASTHAGSNARCSASLAMTVTGLCSTQRSATASMTIAHLLDALDAGSIAWCRDIAVSL
jgi:hypothetical protein